MADGCDELTDKEKETLRLMTRGHDAKSMARELSLSVHTINERLRVARRKLEVTSSREAARILFETEEAEPKNRVSQELGEAHFDQIPDDPVSPETGPRGWWGIGHSGAWLIGGIVMTLLAAALLLSTPLAIDGAGSPDAETAARDAVVEAVARDWLELVEAGNWEASYAGTAAAFREANTLKLWSDTAQRVQGEIGTMLSRELLEVNDVPSPQGYTMVKFHTDYTNRSGVLETLSLVREDGTWKVAGIYVS